MIDHSRTKYSACKGVGYFRGGNLTFCNTKALEEGSNVFSWYEHIPQCSSRSCYYGNWMLRDSRDGGADVYVLKCDNGEII